MKILNYIYIKIIFEVELPVFLEKSLGLPSRINRKKCQSITAANNTNAAKLRY